MIKIIEGGVYVCVDKNGMLDYGQFVAVAAHLQRIASIQFRLMREPERFKLCGAWIDYLNHLSNQIKDAL